MQRVIRDVEPGIACILVSRNNPPGKKSDLADPANIPESFGSGVVIDDAGLILTNYHVVRDAAKIFVRLPGKKSSDAVIHAADPRSDLAVLRLSSSKLALKAIPFGDGGKCARGQFILSIANPYAAGFRDGMPSVSWGIISNVRRRVPGEQVEAARTRSLQNYGILLQTDARLNLGCSGGALINLRGELIGLTTALAAIRGGETPGGFAVPLDAGMRRVIGVLKRGEEVEYGFLGVGRSNQGLGHGVTLENVSPGSPAEQQAHLHMGDTILAINDTPVRELDDLFLALGTQLAGAKVKLQVRDYNGRTRFAEVELVKTYIPGKKIATSPGNRPFFRGLRVDYTSVLVLEQQRLMPIPKGVYVSEIRPVSSAATAKLKVGEIIARVNGRRVNKPADFYEAVASATGPVELTLNTLTPNETPPKVILP